MLQLQTRLLLDVSRQLEDSRLRVLRVLQVRSAVSYSTEPAIDNNVVPQVQREPKHRQRVRARPGSGSSQEIPPLF